MQIGMIGLGRMSVNMVRRLLGGGHACVVHDVSIAAVQTLVREGASGATALDAFVQQLAKPRVVHNGIEYWLMAASAEGLDIARHADVGKRTRATDAETTPLRDPAYLLSPMRFEFGGHVEKKQ